MSRFFQDINSVLIGGITVTFVFALSFLFWVFSPTTLVPLWGVVSIIIVSYLIVIMVYVTSKRNKAEVFRLPKVIKIINREDAITLLLEKNELFSIHSVVSIYYEDDIQHYLGIGYIETINDMGNLQLKFFKIEEDKQDLVSSFKDISKTKSAIKIRPTINISILKGATL